MATRRKVAAVLRDFSKEIRSLSSLDAQNQQALATKQGQLVLSTEAVFFRAFRAYERFLEDTFLLYVMSKPTMSGNVFGSFLRPKDFVHARELVKAEHNFLDWTEPSKVMGRAERFLKRGGTVYSTLAAAKADLQDMKTVRNHIAHNSVESGKSFDNLIRRVRGTLPLSSVTPGDHLLTRLQVSPNSYYLSHYLKRLDEVAKAIAEV